MVDFTFGTPLVLLDARKTKMKRLSHKDLIIALGILVAAAIVFTSVYFKEIGAETKAVKSTPEKKIKPAAILKTMVHKFSSHTAF
jgi:hypothetical protein